MNNLRKIQGLQPPVGILDSIAFSPVDLVDSNGFGLFTFPAGNTALIMSIRKIFSHSLTFSDWIEAKIAAVFSTTPVYTDPDSQIQFPQWIQASDVGTMSEAVFLGLNGNRNLAEETALYNPSQAASLRNNYFYFGLSNSDLNLSSHKFVGIRQKNNNNFPATVALGSMTQFMLTVEEGKKTESPGLPFQLNGPICFVGVSLKYNPQTKRVAMRWYKDTAPFPSISPTFAQDLVDDYLSSASIANHSEPQSIPLSSIEGFDRCILYHPHYNSRLVISAIGSARYA